MLRISHALVRGPHGLGGVGGGLAKSMKEATSLAHGLSGGLLQILVYSYLYLLMRLSALCSAEIS